MRKEPLNGIPVLKPHKVDKPVRLLVLDLHGEMVMPWWSRRVLFHDKTKDALYAMAKGCCHYCKRKMKREDMTVDHKHPLFRGGTHDAKNLVAACFKCNQLKGNTTYRTFQRRMRKAPEERAKDN